MAEHPNGQDLEDFILITESDTDEKDGLGEKAEIVASIKVWLQPTDFDADTSEYRKHLNAHVHGTGKWVLETAQYKRWHQTDDVGDLWIRGIPGSGKSVVAANLVRQLKSNEQYPVLFFFFRQIIFSNRSPQAFLRDASTQLLDHSPPLQTNLKELMKKHPNIEHVPLDELFRVFSSALAAMKKVYCILDALDEMNLGEDVFLAKLLDLGRRYPKSIKLALTSRQLPYLEAQFKGSCLVDLRLDRINVDNDISKYIEHRLEKTQSCMENDEAQSIKKAICEKGKGLFLYARMMMDECVRDPKRFMSQALPDGLGNMYTDLLAEHASRSGLTQDFQSLVLEWVTHSQRPLRLTELTEIINSNQTKGESLKIQDTKKSIRNCCGPLLEVCEDEVTQIIHHSLTEFLLGSDLSHVAMGDGDKDRFPVLNQSFAHAKIAIACIEYLQSGCFKDNQPNDRCESSTMCNSKIWHDNCFSSSSHFSNDIFKQMNLNFSFFKYATEYWHVHAALGGGNEQLIRTLDTFMVAGEHDFECWKDFWGGFKSHMPKNLTPLHVAAHCGLDAYVESLLRRGGDANSLDGFNRSPLFYAAMDGHFSTASILLKDNATTRIFDGSGMTAVLYAAKRGHAKVLQVLFTAGADPLVQKERDDPFPRSGSSFSDTPPDIARGCTALYYICSAGYVESLEVLLQYTSVDEINRQAIFWAIKAGKSEILKILLRNPWNVNALDSWKTTPLFYAARNRDPATVRVLILAGADPNITSEALEEDSSRRTRPKRRSMQMPDVKPVRRFTALHGWASLHSQFYYTRNESTDKDMVEVLDMLLNAGADINAVASNGETAIFGWSSSSLTKNDRGQSYVSWLLDRGADATLLDEKGNSVLHHLNGNLRQRKIADLFIEAGVDINLARKIDGQTPLIKATREHQVMNPTIFHDLGADFNIQDDYGNTAFHYACTSWCMEDLHSDIWLSYADPSIRNHVGALPVSFFKWGNGGKGRVNTFSKVMKFGVDFETKDHRGRTLLLSFLGNGTDYGNEHMVRELLSLGADAKARDYDGRTVTDLSWIGGDADVDLKNELMQDLITAGADIHAIDNFGNTIFHDSISWDTFWKKAVCSVSVVVKSGVDLQRTNFCGRTALHIAATKKCDGAPPEANGSPGTHLDFVLQPHLGFDVNSKDNEGIAPLHLAAETSVINVWKLINAGADLRALDNLGRNALHYASKSKICDIVDLLIHQFRNHEISIDQQDLNGRTPLHEAARCGKMECVQALLNAGANPKVKDRRMRSPLHAAAEFEALSPARESQRVYDEQKPNCGNIRGQPPLDDDLLYASPLLHTIIKTEKHATQIREVVKLLIAAGCDVTARDGNGRTPSDVALMLGNQVVMQELTPFMRDAYKTKSLKYTDTFGEYISQRLNPFEVIDALNLSSSSLNLLERVFCDGDSRIIKATVEALEAKRVPLIATDGLSPIHTVVRWGLVSVFEQLVPLIQDINAFIPPLLHTAIEREDNNIAILKSLIDNGASLDYVYSEKGYGGGKMKTSTIAQILSTGTHYWHTQALALVIEAGANFELENDQQKNCLHLALSRRAASGSTEWEYVGFWGNQILDVLLKHGVKLNTVSSSNLTPLNVALESRRDKELVRKLLDHGADGSFGPVPAISSAIDCLNIDTLEMLLEAGTNPNFTYTATNFKRHEDEKRIESPLFNAAASSYRYSFVGDFKGENDGLRKQALVVDLLMKYGANPLQEANDGRSTTLHEIAAVNGMITPACLKGIDLELKDANGMTMLHRACDLPAHYKRSIQKEHASIVFIEAGADVNSTDNKGFTPLHYAIEASLETTAKLLLKNGASVTTKNGHNLSSFQSIFVAKDSLYPAFRRWAIEPLLEAGADPLELDNHGKSILHQIAPQLMRLSSIDSRDARSEYCEKDNPADLIALKAMYERCIALGCDPEGKDDSGNTPIFAYVAAVKYYSEVSVSNSPDEKDQREMFANHDLLKVNKQGEGLLHVVARREECSNGDGKDGLRLWEILVGLGLDPRREDERGWSALDVAAACGNTKILDLYKRKD